LIAWPGYSGRCLDAPEITLPWLKAKKSMGAANSKKHSHALMLTERHASGKPLANGDARTARATVVI